MGSNGICCGAITSSLVWRSWWELLQYCYKRTFWRAMQHRAVWCENQPEFQRKFIHSHSLLDVDIRVVLTYHHHPSKKGPVLSQLNQLLLSVHFHLLCIGLPGTKLCFLYCKLKCWPSLTECDSWQSYQIVFVLWHSDCMSSLVLLAGITTLVTRHTTRLKRSELSPAKYLKISICSPFLTFSWELGFCTSCSIFSFLNFFLFWTWVHHLFRNHFSTSSPGSSIWRTASLMKILADH